MTFGEKLQELRKQVGLSQEQLAEKCSISRQSVSKWELGQGYPETEKLLVLCRALNVDLDYLLRDEIENKSIPHQEAVINPYEEFLGQWVTLLLYEADISAIRLAAITAMNDQYIVFEREGKIGIIRTSDIKAISEAMITEKQASSLPPVTTFDLQGSDNPYELLQGKPCIIKLKKSSNSIFSDAKAFSPAKITKVTDGNLLFSFRGKDLMVKSDDVLMVTDNSDVQKSNEVITKKKRRDDLDR